RRASPPSTLFPYTALFRSRELGVRVGALEDEIGAAVVAVAHQALGLLDLVVGVLQVERRLRHAVRTELARAARGSLRGGELVGRLGEAAPARGERQRGEGDGCELGELNHGDGAYQKATARRKPSKRGAHAITCRGLAWRDRSRACRSGPSSS